FTQVCELAPNDFRGPNNLAWVLVIRPDNSIHDPLRAVQLAQQAVALAPENANCWNTLGIANFRSGRWDAARISFDKAISVGNHTSLEPDTLSLFHLAMA